jgi:hypothetical protein
MAVRLSSIPLYRPVINFFPSVVTRLFNTFHIPMPRRCMMLSGGALFLGLSTFVLMLIGALPLNFLVGFLGFAAVVTGAVMLMVFCGEI